MHLLLQKSSKLNIECNMENTEFFPILVRIGKLLKTGDY